LTFEQSEFGTSEAHLELMSREPSLLLQAHGAFDKIANLILVSVVLKSNKNLAARPGF
jgi:hypothetical protein